MRRLGACLLVVGLVLLTAVAVEAEEPVMGTFTDLGSFAIEPPCSFIRQVASLDADLGALGAAEIDLDVCLEFAPAGFPASGTLTLTTAEGTLAGTVSGTSQAGSSSG